MRREFLVRTLPIRLGVLLLGGVVISAAGCSHKERDAAAANGAATAQTAPGQATAIPVSVTKATERPISDVAYVTGALNSLSDVIVGVKSNGKVVAVYAREGDHVTAGQVVAQQDTTDLQSQLDQQRANLLAAQTRLDQARISYQDANTNLILTEQQTASAVKQARAGFQSSQEELAIVKQGARQQERAEAEQAMQSAKADRASAAADRDKATSDLKRYEALYRDQAVSAQELDQAQSVKDAADARYNSMVAKYNSSVQALSLIQEGSRPEDIRKAEAAVEEANQTLVSAIANQNQVVLRRADVVTARSNIASAAAGISLAQAQVRVAEQAIRDSTVISPITGIVAERKIEPGMQATTVKADVMRIVSIDDIYFDAQLNEAQYSQVKIGLPVEVTVDAQAGKTFHGTITRIFPVASSQARSFTTRINIRNEGNALRPQMFARGRIILDTHAHAVVVPHDAVLDMAAGSARVFVVYKGVAKQTRVKTGIVTQSLVEILSGVADGDLVVTTGQGQLQDGDAVQINSDTSSPSAAP